MSSRLPLLLSGTAALLLLAGTLPANPCQLGATRADGALRFVQVELTKFGVEQQLDVSGAGRSPFEPPPVPVYHLQVAFQVESRGILAQAVDVEVAFLLADGSPVLERQRGGAPGTNQPARRSATLAFDPEGRTGTAAARFPYADLILEEGRHQLTVVLSASAGGVQAAHRESLDLKVPVSGPLDDLVIVDAEGNTGRLGELPVPAAKDAGLNEALFAAAVEGDAEKIQILLSQGADPRHLNANGRTALHLAAEHGHVDAVKVLATAPPVGGARKKHSDLPEGGGLFGETLDPSKPGTKEEEAAFEERLKTLSFDAYLEDLGANLCAKDRDGLTPLHLAVAGGHFEVVDLLAGFGVGLDQADLTGLTPLHVAALEGDDACCALLLAKGADPCVRNADGRTPLGLADADSVRQRLKKALEKRRNDPEHTAARRQVLAFLDAVARGNAGRALLLVTPEQAGRLPERMDPSSIEPEILGVEVRDQQATVVVRSRIDGAPSECKEFKTTFLLRRSGQDWLIAEIRTVPFVDALDREEDR